MRKILVILLPIILIGVNVLAADVQVNNGVLTKTIIIHESQESEFLDGIQEKIVHNGRTYRLIQISKERLENTITETRERTRTLELGTNTVDSILRQFPQNIIYDNEGFKGELHLQIHSLNTSTIRHGVFEQVFTIEKTYTNLHTADLDYIPKQIIYNGYVYYLTECIWEIVETVDIAGVTMPARYIARTIYSTVKTLEYPNTYRSVVRYVGEVTRITNDTLQYTLTYLEEQEEVIQEEIEREQLPILPIVGGTGFFIVVAFFILPNAKIMNYSNGKYRVVKRVRVSSKNPQVNLKHLSKATSNVFIIVFKEKTANKLKGRYVRIITSNNTIQKGIINNKIEVNI